MAIVYITKKMHFNAAHRLHSELLNEQENKKVYGECNNPMGHGHNYELEVTVRGKPDSVTGMVINLKELKDIIQKTIIDKVDHKHLNHDVKFMKGLIPTAENLAVAFWTQLKDNITGCELHEIKVIETPRNLAIYRGE